MAALTGLQARRANISDLTGLEHAINLTWLNLQNNTISDISVLGGLTNLTSLHLDNNTISDISVLSGLTNLTWLNLQNNSISDLSALITNTGLGNGDLVNVKVNPLSPISIETHIPALQSRGVTVEFDDIVAGVLIEFPDPNLRAVIEEALGKASGDPITTSDMAALTGLQARRANISDLTGLEHAINLTWLNLQNNTISDISVLGGLTNLTSLHLDNNTISDISVLSGLTNLTWLNLQNNSISDISALVSNIGLGSGDTVNVRVNPLSSVSIGTHIPVLQSRGVTVDFDDIVAGVVVEFPDPNLRAAIERRLDIASGDPITTSDMAALTGLIANDSNISDLTGLEHAINLTQLSLHGNSISDITSLGGLTNLTLLYLNRNSISDISVLSVSTNLTDLSLFRNSISDLSALVANTGLGSGDTVNVQANPLSSLSINAHIPALQSRGVTIEFDDIVAGVVVEFSDPNLRAVIERALGKALGDPITTSDMATLTGLNAENSNIIDLTGLEHAINLTSLSLRDNTISDISSLAGLTNLTWLNLQNNTISDISALGGLTNLTSLSLDRNSISDISVLSGLTNLTQLSLGNNSILDITSLSGLTNLTHLSLWSNTILDIALLVSNAGLGSGDEVYLYQNPLSYQSIHTHVPTLQNRGVTVRFDDRTPTRLMKISGDNQEEAGLASLPHPFVVEVRDERGQPFAGVPVVFTVVEGGGTLSVTRTTTDAHGRAESTLTLGPSLGTNTVSVSAAEIERVETFNAISDTLPTDYRLSIPAGISLIHVPLKVAAVDGMEGAIESVSDLYDALGGASVVNFLITYDSQTQEWRSYFGASDKDTPGDRRLMEDTGIVAGIRAPVSIQLRGDALGTDGNSTITLNQGLNLVGLPLRDSRVTRVSDLFGLDGIGGNVPVIILTDGGEFKAVGRAGDPGDVPVTGGQAFILTAQREVSVEISGSGWYNASTIAAASPMPLSGIQVTDTTPVLALRGSVVDEGTGVNRVGLRVKVKNLSTDRAITAVTGDEGNGYQLTVVDIEAARAAQVGDILEISAQSPNPFIGVQPFWYTVTADDVKRGVIQLPALVAYEIPAKTELLANYPNPFNPETWIPYRLAEDAFVTLTIYDEAGRVVRTLDVGHQVAAVYESRSKAIYWDGRNGLGETVASGVYFYHLSAGEFSATRKMLILK